MELAGYPDAVERAGAFKDMHPEVVIEYQDGRHVARRDGEVLAHQRRAGRPARQSWGGCSLRRPGQADAFAAARLRPSGVALSALAARYRAGEAALIRAMGYAGANPARTSSSRDGIACDRLAYVPARAPVPDSGETKGAG